MNESTQHDSIIGKLWHSEVHDLIPTELTQQLHAECRGVESLEKALLEELNDEQRALFHSYLNQLTTANAVEAEQAFRKGFKLAIRIMAQSLL